jgi:tetratricopeptide (TPR) repeat protein
MKKIFLSFATAIIFTSCGEGLESKKSGRSEQELISGEGLEPKKSGFSEQELIKGFEGVKLKFKNVFENPNDFNQESLRPLNDSLAYYIETLINEYPKTKELPELLCRAGISSLNVKNAEKALEYLTFVVDSFPDHKIVPQSMYFIGRTKEVLVNDIIGAKESYKKLYRAYPNSVWGKNAKTSVELIVNPLLLEKGLDEESDKLNND